jgi:2-oxoisovalerate ferredoxin oxidoreductase beta subunit
VAPEFKIRAGRSKTFYPVFERKSELRHQTHYCPGCGHGIVHKMIAKAIDTLGVQDRVILISPVGCSVFAYYYLDVGNIQGAHGRAPAIATAVKRSRPGSIVIGYQGDGDLSAIGSAEILHAANRGENITIIFVNNAIYGMTGGQMAPTTPLDAKTITTPLGRDPLTDGYPLHMSEVLATLDAPVYIERVALGDNKLIAHADRAIHKAIENQVKGRGFSMVEVLSPCPTIWKKDPVEAQRWVREELTKTFQIGVYRDRASEPARQPKHVRVPPLDEVPKILGIGDMPVATTRDDLEIDAALDLRIKIAGFGGQGVLLLGEVLAEAGLEAGLEVSWLPSYGPEMRSGTSNCHVRLSRKPIDSPLVSDPDILIAMNEPSLRKFLPSVQAGGWVLFNGEALPEGCSRHDVHMVARNFSQAADDIGDPRAANMVMLGAMLETSHPLPLAYIVGALRQLIANLHMIAIDRRALERGAELVAEEFPGHG